MNGSRNEFFTSACLAMQQHSRVGWRDDGNLIQHFAERGAFANDVFKAVFRPDFRFEVQPFFFETSRRCVQASMCKRIIQCERYLNADLRQQIQVLLPECINFSAACSQQTQGPALGSQRGDGY